MQSVREMLDRDDFEFRFDVGICDASFKVNLSDRDRIVESLATYYTVICVKAYIDQIVDGLKTLGVYELVQSNPRAMQKLFLSRPVPLTSDYILGLFDTCFSLEGTNRREYEEQIMMYWVQFVEIIEGKGMDNYYFVILFT